MVHLVSAQGQLEAMSSTQVALSYKEWREHVNKSLLSGEGSSAEAVRRPSCGQSPGDGVLVAQLVQQQLHRVGAQQAGESHPCSCDGSWGMQLSCDWKGQGNGHTPGSKSPRYICMMNSDLTA